MLTYICVAAILVAGLVHIFIFPSHFAHAPAHGIFFSLLGAAQLGWAFAFSRHASSKLRWMGMALSGGIVVLWILTQVVTPFIPNPIDSAVVVSKISEMIAFVALVGLAWQGQLPALTRWVAPRLVAGSLAVCRTSAIMGHILW